MNLKPTGLSSFVSDINKLHQNRLNDACIRVCPYTTLIQRQVLSSHLVIHVPHGHILPQRSRSLVRLLANTVFKTSYHPASLHAFLSCFTVLSNKGERHSPTHTRRTTCRSCALTFKASFTSFAPQNVM